MQRRAPKAPALQPPRAEPLGGGATLNRLSLSLDGQSAPNAPLSPLVRPDVGLAVALDSALVALRGVAAGMVDQLLWRLSAIVFVGPPLSASCAILGLTFVKSWVAPPKPVAQSVVSPIRLRPAETIVGPG